MNKTEELFAAWEAPMVRACLQGHMGCVRTFGEDSALASIGDFCFLAGTPAPELLERAEWSQDLCGNFAGGSDFVRRGIGFAVLREGEPVSGAASYAVCDGAIEIEIDTRPDHRRLGLASACGARLILECLDRGIYPGWDAHNERSLSLAEKLGYRPDRPYTAYWVEDNVRRGQDMSIN